MARRRDYAAEYARRVELGRRRGVTTAQARGHARRAKGERSVKELITGGQIAPARPPKPAPKRRKVRQVGVGQAVAPDAALITHRRSLRRAAREGMKAGFLVRARDPHRGYVNRYIDGRSYAYSLGEAGVIIEIQTITGPAAAFPGGGLDPAEADQLLKDGGWEALIEWASEQGEF